MGYYAMITTSQVWMCQIILLLTTLWLNDNQLISIDVSDNNLLDNLLCNDNQTYKVWMFQIMLH